VVRQAVLDAYPQIPELLSPVFEALDLETLQRLNGEVAVNGADPAKVAATFLDQLEQ